MLSIRPDIRSYLLASLVLSGAALPASAQRVTLIKICSGWGGLGTPRSTVATIRAENGNFVRNAEPVNTELVQNLVEALQAKPITHPQETNLGIRPAWLKQNTAAVEGGMPGAFRDAVPAQKHLFENSFSDPEVLGKTVPHLFDYVRFDDYPSASVEVTFDDGSKLSASSRSYYPFMIPWKLSAGETETYNADLSRAVSALLPAKATNKERLAGSGFASELAEAVMRQIEEQWKMVGVEGRAGEALAELRESYTVVRADINPYHDVYFGRRWNSKGPHETNLQATLAKASFPEYLQEHLVLQYEEGRVEGLDEFFKKGKKYETLALSVPWLNEYLRQHPHETMTLAYVHNASFGDHAMETFALDMKAAGRRDLVALVRAQQAQIALIKIRFVYWLIFPDHHMILWRYEGPSGFLKWKESDLPAGQCDEYYEVNNGGCPGTEISPDGTLVVAR